MAAVKTLPFTLTEAETLGAFVEINRGRRTTIQWACALFAVGYVVLTPDAPRWLHHLVLVMFGVYIVGLPWFQWWLARQRFRRPDAQRFFIERTFTFDDAGVTISGDKKALNKPWSEVTEFRRLSNGVVFWFGPRSYAFVPTRAFAQPEDVEAALALRPGRPQQS